MSAVSSPSMGIERLRDPLQGQVGAPALGLAEHHPAVLRGFPGLVAERLAPERQHTVKLVATDDVRTDPHRASLEPFDPPGKSSRVHLDLYTADQKGEVGRLLGIGATRHPQEYGPDDDFVVLEDPDGNRFCVVAKPDGG